MSRAGEADHEGLIESGTAAGKLLAILDAFNDSSVSVLSLKQIAERTELAKSTCHRVLAALERWGGVERDDDGRYRVGMKLFELGGLVQGRVHLRDLALPYLQDLLATTRETVNLSTLRGNEIIYLERLTSHRSVRMPGRVAGRFPATCSGAGKAILAFSPKEVTVATMRQGLTRMTPYSISNPVLFLENLEQIRRTGLAQDVEESRLGLHCVAAPIFDRLGDPAAAVSVSGPTGRMQARSVALAVSTTALAISRRLGYQP